MALIKLFAAGILLLALLQSSLQEYTEEDVQHLAYHLKVLRGEDDLVPLESWEDEPDTTESRDLNKNPLTVFNLPQVNILDIRPTEANEKVDLFDKCMRNVLKGQFGHGKYHFTEYKFCKGWFGKKFSNEIELLTEQPEYGFEIDALNSKELLKLNEPEYENMSEDVENQVARIRAEGFRNYFERQKNHESE